MGPHDGDGPETIVRYVLFLHTALKKKKVRHVELSLPWAFETFTLWMSHHLVFITHPNSPILVQPTGFFSASSIPPRVNRP